MIRLSPTIAIPLFIVGSVGCGDNLLTPDRVREHLAAPKGAVAADSVGRSTRDFFAGQRADGARVQGLLAKTLGGDNATQGALASGNRALGALAAMDDGDISAGDVLCASNLALSISQFDECGQGDNCEARLELDACVLRIGEGADPYAVGKIIFTLKNTSSEGLERQELRLTFEDFETSDSETTTQYFDGILAIETTLETAADTSRESVIITGDLNDQIRLIERGFLDNAVQSSTRATGAVRFSASDTATEDAVRIEVLGFVDDSDDARDESVVLTFNASERSVANTSLVEADLTVTGSNGSFQCTWSSAEEQLTDGEGRVQAAGNCVDENGETFSFTADTTSR
jgi:hypothetical protein